MRGRARQRKLLVGAAVLAALLLVLVGGAFSAGKAQPWQWQGFVTSDASRDLIATTSASGVITLAARADPSGLATFVVSANGRAVQEASAASLPSEGPLAAFVVGDGAGGEAIVGVARSDVAHVLLSSDVAAARELPLNSAGAFAASDLTPGRNVQLEALAADSSTIGRIELPNTTLTCGASLGSCTTRTTSPSFAPASQLRATSQLASAAPLYAVLESQAKGVIHDDLTRMDPATLNPVGARLRLQLGSRPGVGAMALSPDQNRLAVAANRGGAIQIVDLETLHVAQRITTRAGIDVRSLAWLDNDQLALVGQQLSMPYARNVIGRWLIRVNVNRGVTAMALPKKAMLQYSERSGSRLISVLAPNNFHDPHRTVVAADADGRTFIVPVSLPAPTPGMFEDRPVASADGTHLYIVRAGGQILDVDIAAGTTVVHDVAAPIDAPATIPQSSVVLADAVGNGLVVSGVFTFTRSGSRAFRSGVYRIDTSSWSATTLDRNSSYFVVYGDQVAAFSSASPAPAPGAKSAGNRLGTGVTVYSGTSGRRLYHVFGKQRFNLVRMIDGYGHGLRFQPGPGVPYGFVDNRFNSRTGVATGLSRPPLNGLRLIYRGSPDIHEPGSAAPASATRKPQSASRPAARRGYTISNRGRPVTSRGNRNLFEGHSYRLFLLGSVGGTAFYRVQLTPHYTCWGSGPSKTIGKIGGSGCPALVGAYPRQLDDTVVELRRGERTPRYIRIDGLVVDQAASVALQDSTGATVKTVPVENNLFSIPPPYPHAFLRVVPLDAHGQPLLPHPEWGEHQTPPANLFGPRAAKVDPASLGTVVQRGEAKGVTVSADQDGVVIFDARSIAASARRLLGGRIAWFACFQISGQNVRQNRSAGISTPLAPVVAFKTVGIKPQYDGCEAGGSYGHRWHDQYGPHSTLEIPLTAQGTRYFEDRATARDLAAFVRSAKTQTIRRKTGAALRRAIKTAYGTEVRFLTASSASAAPGQVGVWTRGSRTIFSERSHLGDRLYVEFDDGKLTHQNVRGLAFVF